MFKKLLLTNNFISFLFELEHFKKHFFALEHLREHSIGELFGARTMTWNSVDEFFIFVLIFLLRSWKNGEMCMKFLLVEGIEKMMVIFLLVKS